jgi:hypothetical protein
MQTILIAGLSMLVLSLGTAGVAAAATPEFKPVPAKKKFTATGGITRFADQGYGYQIECTKSSSSGEVTGAHTVGKVTIVYTGCEGIKDGTCSVNTLGAKAGEIVTKVLAGELGTVAKTQASSGVGLRFKREESKPTLFILAENKCEGALGEESSYTGAVAAEVSVLGKKQTTNKLAFALNGSDGQAIQEITLDSGVVENPELLMFASTLTLQNTSELTFEEPVEVT